MTNEGTPSEEELFLSDKMAEMPEPEPAEPVAVTEPEPPEPVTPETPETDQEAKPEDVKAEEDKDGGGRVPAWRLREQTEALRQREAEMQKERETRLDLERQLAAMNQRLSQFETQKQQQPAPDRWENPDAYEAHRDQILAQQFQQLRYQTLENNAYARFGYDTVQKAMEAAFAETNRNPQLDRMLSSAPNPWEAAVQWHKQHTVLQEVGEDPTAYKERVRAETLAAVKSDPEFRKQVLAEMRAEAGQPQPVTGNQQKSTIPSLNGAPAARKEIERSDISEEELFRL